MLSHSLPIQDPSVCSCRSIILQFSCPLRYIFPNPRPSPMLMVFKWEMGFRHMEGNPCLLESVKAGSDRPIVIGWERNCISLYTDWLLIQVGATERWWFKWLSIGSVKHFGCLEKALYKCDIHSFILTRRIPTVWNEKSLLMVFSCCKKDMCTPPGTAMFWLAVMSYQCIFICWRERLG